MELEKILNNPYLYNQLIYPYIAANRIIQTKLENIDEEMKCEKTHSPIHMIQSRIKSVDSIIEKLERKAYPQTLEGINKLNDIAGIRVVCHYVNDIQYISQLFVLHENIRLIKQSNYIDYPKENGYRSLHLIVEVPVYSKEEVMHVPVELQFRTIAMDCWATLEHELYYKCNHVHCEKISQELKLCAQMMAETDKKMQQIYQTIHNKAKDN